MKVQHKIQIIGDWIKTLAANSPILYRRSSMHRLPRLMPNESLKLFAVFACFVLVSPAARADLVGKYDAGAGTTVSGGTVTLWEDQIGAYDLTNNNTPALETLATPKGNSAIRLDGPGSDALAGPPAAPTGFPLAGATALTVAVVFRPVGLVDNAAANVNFWGHPQLASGDQGGAAPDWGFSWGPNANGTNNIWFGVGNNTGSGTPTVATGNAINNGRWYIGIGTWNGASGISAYLYDQNGMLISSNTLATPSASAARVDVGFATGGERPNLNGRSFDGHIAAIELYNNGVDATGAAAIASSLHSAYLGGTPRIEVNTTTGVITLENTSASDLILDYYEIRSAAGALEPDTWNSLDELNFGAVDGADPGGVAGDSPGEGWDEAGGANTNQLIEYFLAENGLTLPSSAQVSLGNAFDPSVLGAGNNGDLVFNFGLPNGALIPGDIVYKTSTELPGDYNSDGTVNAADYVVWRKNIGTTEGYNLWRTNFGRTSGSGSLVSGSVPEPSLAAMLLAIVAAGCLRFVRGCDLR
jgi:hypothetical protein